VPTFNDQGFPEIGDQIRPGMNPLVGLSSYQALPAHGRGKLDEITDAQGCIKLFLPFSRLAVLVEKVLHELFLSCLYLVNELGVSGCVFGFYCIISFIAYLTHYLLSSPTIRNLRIASINDLSVP
jgi:hypothetical protein